MAFVNQPYREARAIQVIVHQRATQKPADGVEVDNRTLALLARAYKELEELKLRLRMKGPPKAVAAVDKSKSKSHVVIPTES